MEKDFNKLKDTWKAAKRNYSGQAADAGLMLKKARLSHRKAKELHLLTILILSLTCIGLTAFFYYLAPMQDALSRVGIAFMIGGLLVRILIEVFSHYKADRISYDKSMLQSTVSASFFFEWRKKIHGPVTFSIIALYTIGFYLLTPEFSRYILWEWMLIMHVGYIFIAVILYFQIRSGITKEMAHLRRLIEIQHNLIDSKKS